MGPLHCICKRWWLLWLYLSYIFWYLCKCTVVLHVRWCIFLYVCIAHTYLHLPILVILTSASMGMFPRLSVATGSALTWLCEGSAWSAVTDFTDICPHSETSCSMNYWRHTHADLCHDYAKQYALPHSRELRRAMWTAALTLFDNLLLSFKHRNFLGVCKTSVAWVFTPCSKLLLHIYCSKKFSSLHGSVKQVIWILIGGLDLTTGWKRWTWSSKASKALIKFKLKQRST